jgi:hypothetical protein
MDNGTTVGREVLPGRAAYSSAPVMYSPVGPLAEYYLPAGSKPQRWSGTGSIALPSGAVTDGPSGALVGVGNPAAFAWVIAHGHVSFTPLDFADTTALPYGPRRPT